MGKQKTIDWLKSLLERNINSSRKIEDELKQGITKRLAHLEKYKAARSEIEGRLLAIHILS